MQKIILTTGGFDPLHTGHIEYFKAAKALGDILVVGINSDDWLVRKKGQAFMPMHERKTIVENLQMVDHCIEFDDSDGSAIKAIERIKHLYPDDLIIFANGGDRTSNNIPEMSVTGVTFQFGVGGTHKMNSSSWILTEWKAPKTERPWGYYRVLHQMPGIKVKELTVDPGKRLSMQRHEYRAEYWIVAAGIATVNINGKDYNIDKKLGHHDGIVIQPHMWHQLKNTTQNPLQIIEIQYGESCEEEDIERR